MRPLLVTCLATSPAGSGGLPPSILVGLLAAAAEPARHVAATVAPVVTPYHVRRNSPADFPLRVQVAVGGVLVAEWVAPCTAAHETLTAYLRRRHAAGLPLGGSLAQRADLPRVWDVPVGGRIGGAR